MSFIINNDDIEFVRETSDKTLDLMSQHNIVPSPSNYHVWYTFASGSDLSLTQTISAMIDKGKSFSTEVCNNIYQKFFSGHLEQSAIEEAGNGIQQELVKIAHSLKDTSQGTADYSETLQEHLNNLDGLQGGAELSVILNAIMADTSKMEQQTRKLESDLKASSQEIQKLQTNMETLRHESMTDALTNIGNRKMFEEKVAQAIKESNADSSELALIIGDVDHFKKFNDNWGHHVGDQVLKAVAHVLKTRVGEKGSTARYGGEEFVVVMPNTTTDQAAEIANMVRESVSQRSMKRKSTGEKLGKITVSFGIAQYRAGEKRDSFLKRADEALYFAKNTGRNKVVTEHEVSSEQSAVKIA